MEGVALNVRYTFSSARSTACMPRIRTVPARTQRTHLRASRAAPPPICACAILRESTQANSNFTPLAGGRDWRARVKKAQAK